MMTAIKRELYVELHCIASHGEGAETTDQQQEAAAAGRRRHGEERERDESEVGGEL